MGEGSDEVMIIRSRFPSYCLFLLLSAPVAPLSGWNIFGVLFAFVGVILFITFVFIWFNVEYGFAEKGLFVKDGLSAEKCIIAYSLIDRVEMRDGISAELVAGLSYHRIAIFVDGKVRVQISPKDREGFITELERRMLLSENDATHSYPL